MNNVLKAIILAHTLKTTIDHQILIYKLNSVVLMLFHLSDECAYIYMYHFHTSDQRKASAHISHIALAQNVNEIYALP